jgi:single-strand DNA-binding protein
MSSLNKAQIIGRLGQDPEVRYTQSNTAVATLSVATSEKFKNSEGELQEKTEWHRVTAWGRLAEICQQYLTKGSLVYIEGPIQTRSWEDNAGIKRYTTEINAKQMTMLDSKKTNGVPHPATTEPDPLSPAGKGARRTVEPTTPKIDKNFQDNIDDDLPF